MPIFWGTAKYQKSVVQKIRPLPARWSRNIAEIFGIWVPGLLYDIVCVILGLAIFVQLQLVMDRQIYDDSIYCASIARMVKIISWRYLNTHAYGVSSGQMKRSLTATYIQLIRWPFT